MNEQFFIYDNSYYRAGIPVITTDNRSFRYGDGLFETMRMHSGKVLNADLHFDRLFSGMRMLQFNIPEYFSKDFFLRTVNELLLKNSILHDAKVRLIVFRGDSEIFDITNNFPHFIIETSPLFDEIKLNEKGLTIEVFPDVRKSCDAFSNLKSNNYLASVMAARFAKINSLDDAIILNTFDRVCESSIANIFILKNNLIITPPLSEGCVAGVMRRWLLEKFSLKNYLVSEKNISIDDVLNAEEVFLTNAIKPIRWVKSFGGKVYENKKVNEIFNNVVESFLRQIQ